MRHRSIAPINSPRRLRHRRVLPTLRRSYALFCPTRAFGFLQPLMPLLSLRCIAPSCRLAPRSLFATPAPAKFTAVITIRITKAMCGVRALPLALSAYVVALTVTVVSSDTLIRPMIRTIVIMNNRRLLRLVRPSLTA